MLVDTIFYFYGVKIMKNIDNKVKLDSLFKDLNFNVSELKRMYNKYNSPYNLLIISFVGSLW